MAETVFPPAKTLAQGAPLGLLMLETRFPRPPGDIGNPDSFPFPILVQSVTGASAHRVVNQRAEGLLPPFIEAAKRLEDRGAAAISTSCGFLALFQRPLAAAVSIPVATSSLFQVNLINALLPPGRKTGVLTISDTALSQDHLTAAGVPLDTPVGSTEGGQEFTRAILSDAADLDRDKARADHVDAARHLLARHPEVGALVLECTNMGPYAAAIAEAVDRPVYTVIDFLIWFQRGLKPARY